MSKDRVPYGPEDMMVPAVFHMAPLSVPAWHCIREWDTMRQILLRPVYEKRSLKSFQRASPPPPPSWMALWSSGLLVGLPLQKEVSALRGRPSHFREGCPQLADN